MDQVIGESPYEELNRFRNFFGSPDDLEIPLRPEHRKKTNSSFTIAFIVVVLILIPLVVYTLMYSGFRNLNGADNCGNFCGFKNEKYDDWACTGKDMTDKPYLVIDRDQSPFPQYLTKHCEAQCPAISSSCTDNVNEGDAVVYQKALKDVEDGSWIIFLSTFISCLLCYGMILLFKYAVKETVWFLLIGSIGVLIIAAISCMIGYIRTKGISNSANQSYLVFAIVFGAWALLAIIFMTCLFSRIQLIIELFKEASKSIFEIPGLAQLPILTFVGVTICLTAFCILTLYMSTAKKLMEMFPGKLEYKVDGTILFTMIYNFFVYIWVMQFIIGAQYMVVAGAISAWFFTRNKQYLDRPLWRSFMNMIKFHLGTLFIGSLIITIVIMIRMILRALRNKRTRFIVLIIECCCGELLALLKLFSKNAYIQTAMHGQPFFKSGKRAVQLLVSNVENLVAINSIGDFVLFVAQFLLVVVGTAITYAIAWAVGNPQATTITIICGVLNVLMVINFFGIFEAAIDSLFICFCEDTNINDGMARPYYMTKGLHQFVENCKCVFPK